MRNRRGFTLVELLVVIGIIALLISILLPTLNTARGFARRTMCSSNLRQIGIGLLTYANDNGDYYPWAQLSYSPAAGENVVLSWDDMIQRSLGGAASDEDRLATHWPRRVPVLECPADDIERVRTSAYTSAGDVFPRSYAMVRAFGYDNVHNRRFRGAGGQFASGYPINWGQITPSLLAKRGWYNSPTDKFVITERPLPDNIVGGYGAYVDTPVDHWRNFDTFWETRGKTHHARTWHSLCADGHVEGNTIEQAILLPPLQKARPQAQQIMMRSSLKQIRIAIAVYETPMLGYLPGMNPIPGEEYDAEKRE